MRAGRVATASTSPAARAISSAGCTPFIATSAPSAARDARAEARRTSRGRRTRARSTTSNGAVGAQVLDARRDATSTLAQPQLDRRLRRGTPPSCGSSRAATTCQSGRAIAIGMPGSPPPLPTSSTRDAARRRQLRQHGERVEQRDASPSLGLADRGQVVRAVPLREQREIRRRAARAARSSARGRARRCRRPSRRRCPARRRGVMRAAPAGGRRAALQVHEQQRDRRGRDARHARRLADGFRPVPAELLLHLVRQAAHRCGSRGRRERASSPAPAARDLVVLAIDVARVLGRDLDLLRDVRSSTAGPAPGSASASRSRRRAGAADRRARTLARAAARARARIVLRDDAGTDAASTSAARVSRSIARACAQNASQRASSTRPESPAVLGEPQVGVVLAQLQAVLGARREHAVRLRDAAGDEIVDQHAEVRLVAPRAPAVLAARTAARALMPASRPCAAASS